MRNMKSEDGLTLVELLAAIVITSIIATVAYTVFFSGFKAYDRVKIEAALRDEADIIMAELISDLYTLNEDDIKTKHLPEQKNEYNYFVELTSGEKIGFIDGKIHLKNEGSKSLQTGQIKLHKDTKITEVARGDFHIMLTLECTEGSQILSTESEIGIIKSE